MTKSNLKLLFPLHVIFLLFQCCVHKIVDAIVVSLMANLAILSSLVSLASKIYNLNMSVTIITPRYISEKTLKGTEMKKGELTEIKL